MLATIDAIKIDAGKVVQEAEAEIARDTTYRDSLTRRDALGVRLRALDDPRLLKLAQELEKYRTTRSDTVQRQLDQVDNGYHRFISGANARTYLEQWLRLEKGTAQELDQWDAAITKLEKK